jgi:hypothetical protein
MLSNQVERLMSDRAFHFAHEGTKKHEGHEDGLPPLRGFIFFFVIFV